MSWPNRSKGEETSSSVFRSLHSSCQYRQRYIGLVLIIIVKNPEKKMADSIIRQAYPDDSKAINRLSRSLGYTENSDSLARLWLNQILSSDNEKVWVFEKDARIIGWIHAFRAHRVASAPFVEIGGMAVDPDNRRRGVGGRLIEQTMQWARKQKLSLRVRCNTEREATHEFYEAVGFTKVKSQYVYESRR